jgi:hypothetical protein
VDLVLLVSGVSRTEEVGSYPDESGKVLSIVKTALKHNHNSQKSVSSVLDCTTGLTTKIKVKNGIDCLKPTN